MILKTLLFLSLLAFSSISAAEDADDLFAAALAGKPDRLAALLAQGVDVNARTAGGRTALMAASFNGNVRAVKVLLGYGADVNVADDLGITALMDALVFGDQQIVTLLLAAGADVNATDNRNQSVLARAKKTPYKHLITMLEQAGAKEKVATAAGEEGDKSKQNESATEDKQEAQSNDQ